MSTSFLPDTLTFPVPILPRTWKLDDLQTHLGDIPLSRIRMFPPPGMATEDDAAALRREEGVLCEVVDGVLVEKTMGWKESVIAVYLAHLISAFIAGKRLGVVLGPDGQVRTTGGQVRLPDVAFIRWDRIPPAADDQNICPTTPDLAVEVLSQGNTAKEIERKLDEYFSGGTQLAWIIDPRRRTAEVYTARHHRITLTDAETLDASPVLPGFKVSIAELLDSAERPQ
jgi:Uma2 family endonuclease